MPMKDLRGWVAKDNGFPKSILSVPEDAEPVRKNGRIYWPAVCECGNKKLIQTSKLLKGQLSCGCRGGGYKDITNQRFGKLTALYQIMGNSCHTTVWHCKCDCGNYCDVKKEYLLKGATKSCGCAVHESAVQWGKNRGYNLVGKTFGLLTVIEDTGKRTKDNSIIWKCKCDCGNYKEIPTYYLTNNHTKSCGCIGSSYGEAIIKKILNDNKIKYIYDENYFSDLIGVKNYHLRYDFIILDENDKPKLCVEFDGQQHFRAYDYYGGEERFKILQQNDHIKNEYAWSHNIPIVRIPYTEKNITLDTIMGDQYLVRPPQESGNEN